MKARVFRLLTTIFPRRLSLCEYALAPSREINAAKRAILAKVLIQLSRERQFSPKMMEPCQAVGTDGWRGETPLGSGFNDTWE